MPDHRYIVVPRADRHGHPEGVISSALALTSDEHGVTALYCDKYGHIVADEQWRMKSATESRAPKSEFVLR